MEWTARLATMDDIPYLAENLREADKAEVYASSGHTAQEALEEAFGVPNDGIWVGVYKGKPEIIFGVTKAHEGLGFPWMLCTDKLKESPKEFIQKCKRWVKGFSLQTPTMVNFVHAENTLHIRWLKWCGFDFVKLHDTYGFSKEPFWEFQMIRKE